MKSKFENIKEDNSVENKVVIILREMEKEKTKSIAFQTHSQPNELTELIMKLTDLGYFVEYMIDFNGYMNSLVVSLDEDSSYEDWIQSNVKI